LTEFMPRDNIIVHNASNFTTRRNVALGDVVSLLAAQLRPLHPVMAAHGRGSAAAARAAAISREENERYLTEHPEVKLIMTAFVGTDG
jgi:hypothetical protein